MSHVFEHIPHVERKVFKRTTMNEVSLFLTYNPTSLAKMRQLDLDFGFIKIGNDERGKGHNEMVSYKDKDVLVTFLNTGVLVSVPAMEYRDFETTSFVWEHLEKIMNTLAVEPAPWLFTKGNRFVFTEPITESNRQEALDMVFSTDYLSFVKDRRLFFEESIDKTKLFSCQYGFEESKKEGVITVKYLIATQSYSIDGLCDQIMETNKLMFDGWHWSMSKGMLNFLDQDKGGAL